MELKDKSGFLGGKIVVLAAILFILTFAFQKIARFFLGFGSGFIYGFFNLLSGLSLTGFFVFVMISAFKGPITRKKTIENHLINLTEKSTFGKVIDKRPTTLSFKVIEQVSSLTRQYYFIDFLLEDNSQISVIATGEMGNLILPNDQGFVIYKEDENAKWLIDFEREV